MFAVTADRWSLDKDLQIVHADIRLKVQGDILIEEPVCVDVGLPAFLFSALHDVTPNRFASADEWERMPFFVCGCGDPECRGFSFTVRHIDDNQLEFTCVEERQGGGYRELESYVLDKMVYRRQVLGLGQAFLKFVEGLDYRPYFADTVKVVSELAAKLSYNN